MSRIHNLPILLIITLLLALVAAQCGAAVPEPATAPSTETAPAEPVPPAEFEATGLDDLPGLSGQTLDILTWDGYAPDELVTAFEQATGATVNVTYVESNSELAAKLQNEDDG
jgi:spermidine/putrescine-binding protein